MQSVTGSARKVCESAQALEPGVFKRLPRELRARLQSLIEELSENPQPESFKIGVYEVDFLDGHFVVKKHGRQIMRTTSSAQLWTRWERGKVVRRGREQGAADDHMESCG